MKNIRSSILIAAFILIQIVPIIWIIFYSSKNEDRVEDYYSVTVPNNDANLIISEKSREGYILISRNCCCDEYPNELCSNNCMISISMVKFKK
jgi:ABC-type glycerol-3-phosphate transport system permease component